MAQFPPLHDEIPLSKHIKRTRISGLIKFSYGNNERINQSQSKWVSGAASNFIIITDSNCRLRKHVSFTPEIDIVNKIFKSINK